MYPTDKSNERREECGGWGRDEGSYVVCNITHVIAEDGGGCGWWRDGA
jgi:hypothetical protein